jgi:hypothetical protein
MFELAAAMEDKSEPQIPGAYNNDGQRIPIVFIALLYP